MGSPWGYNSADYYATNAWEPQRAWQYEMIIKGLDTSSLGLTGNSTLAELSPVMSEMTASIVKLSIQEVNLPDFSFDVVKINKAFNRKKGIANGYSIGTMSLTLLDDCQQDIDKLMYRWCQATINPYTGEYGKTDNYKKTGCLAKFSPDGVQARFWIFQGLFPIRYSQSNFSRSSNNVTTISLNLNVDMAFPAGVQELAEHGFVASMFL